MLNKLEKIISKLWWSYGVWLLIAIFSLGLMEAKIATSVDESYIERILPFLIISGIAYFLGLAWSDIVNAGSSKPADMLKYNLTKTEELIRDYTKKEVREKNLDGEEELSELLMSIYRANQLIKKHISRNDSTG